MPVMAPMRRLRPRATDSFPTAGVDLTHERISVLRISGDRSTSGPSCAGGAAIDFFTGADHCDNHYEWGDLKGDPRKFMECWFDLHLYLANWNTRRLMIKVPKRFVNQAEIDPFLREIDWVKVWTSGDNLIVDICRDEVEVCDDWHDGSGQLAALSPLRADVLSGDFRLLDLLKNQTDGRQTPEAPRVFGYSVENNTGTQL